MSSHGSAIEDQEPESGAPLEPERRGRTWPLLVLLVVAGATLLVMQMRRPAPANPLVGRGLPPLEVAGWVNTTRPLAADDLRGDVVLVDFWATSCPTCLSHTPQLMDYYARFRRSGLRLIGLTHESGPEVDRVKSYVEKANIDWPIGYGAAFTYELMGIEGTPTYVLYDRTGRSIWAGHSLSGLEDATLGALAKQPEADAKEPISGDRAAD